MNKKTTMLVLSGLSLLLAAGPARAQGADAAKPQVVQVKLNEWTMGLETMKVKGPVQFEVTNTGKYPHAMAIEGTLGGKPFEISTGWLKAGEKTTLTVNLPAGTYNSYCPVPGHEAKGMKSDLTFE
ncbi:plastocyanin/azurin family copper-binding protein [Deinococcus sp. UYEF24]